jgi:hypothetical protein
MGRRMMVEITSFATNRDAPYGAKSFVNTVSISGGRERWQYRVASSLRRTVFNGLSCRWPESLVITTAPTFRRKVSTVAK